MLLPLLLMAAACDDDTPTTPSSNPSLSFLRIQCDERDRQSRWHRRRRCHLSATRGSRRARVEDLARLSDVERDPTNNNLTTHARNRIGSGPWHSANLVLVANNVAELHARTGDATLFVDERGQRINGQWTGSPGPNEHDIGDGIECRRHAGGWIDMQ